MKDLKTVPPNDCISYFRGIERLLANLHIAGHPALVAAYTVLIKRRPTYEDYEVGSP